MRFIFLAALLSFALSSAWAQLDQVDTTIIVDNVGANAYVLTASEGENVAELGSDNAAWTLQIGRRYRIVNNGERLFHPFELRSDEAVLLAQGDLEGTFEESADVEFISDDAGINFTLTPELAEVLTSYRCTFHPSMTGKITVDGL